MQKNKYSHKRRGHNNSSRGNRNFSGGRRRGNRGGRNRGPKRAKINPSLYRSKPEQQEVEQYQYEGKYFAEYNFDARLFTNLKDKGFVKTTEIQEKTISSILEGKDMLGISETGSGKTGAFLIPMIQKVLTDKSQRVLIIAPTRELAQQIEKEARNFTYQTGIFTTLVIGGESITRQSKQIKRGSAFIIGTPGRIQDLVKRNVLDLHKYNNIVVDEVDRMMDMGFIGDIRFIFNEVADKKQSLFFSATHNNNVEKTVKDLTHAFEIVRLTHNSPNKNVVQSVIDYTHNENKIDLLQDILKKEEVSKAIIFVDTKRFADKVDNILYKNKFKVGVIHGDKRQNQRKKIIDNFKHSKINVLVATNVAARGIDIQDITHVINLDEPQTYDEYIHRIGRTGRNGETGTAYTFVKR